MNKFSTYLLIFMVVLGLTSGCKKVEPVPLLEVLFLTPDESAVFQVPDTILVTFFIENESPLKYVRISIGNNLLIPLSPQISIYPTEDTHLFEVQVPIGALAFYDSVLGYIHILVEDEHQTTHWYQKIELRNSPFLFKGFSVITKDTGANSKLYFFDEQYAATAQLSVAGSANLATSVPESDLLLLSTQSPEEIMAIRFSDQQIQWTRSPQLPYPEFTAFQYKFPFLYFGTGTGRVVSVYAETGLQNLETPVFDSYYPTAIVVSDQKIVIGNISRTGLISMISTCYRSTGSVQHNYPIDFDMVCGFPVSESENVVLFGNMNNKATMMVFDPDENQVISTITYEFGNIEQVVSIDEKHFLVNSSTRLIRVDSETGEAVVVFNGDDLIADFAFEQTSSRLFMAIKNEVLIFSYPGFTMTDKLTFAEKSKYVCFRYDR